VHPLLLKGQGVTVEHPPRFTGTLTGAALAGVASALAVALLVKASTWPPSLTLFLAILGVTLLAALTLFFAFWAWSCYSLRYVLDRGGLTIFWGAVRHHLPIEEIVEFKHGRGEMKARVSGLAWPGHKVGHGYADDIGSAIFFSTHRSPEDIVFVKTRERTYAISPTDPARFIAEALRFKEVGQPDHSPPVQWSVVGLHPIWSDRWAQWLGIAAIGLNLALCGFVLGFYPSLDNQITIEFPPIGDITTLQSRSEILTIPATASVFLVVNLIAGLIFQWRERAAAYLLMGGTVILQVAFCIAAIVALVNA
jgi:hypothetical protein